MVKYENKKKIDRGPRRISTIDKPVELKLYGVCPGINKTYQSK